MKKYISVFLIIFFSFTVTACSNSDDKEKPEVAETNKENVNTKTKNKNAVDSSALLPVDIFIEDYNNLASLTEELKPLSKDEPVDENNTQILLNDDTYAILAIFDKNDEVSFYSLGLTREDPYEELKGSGLYATLNTGATLGLDVDKMTSEFETALNKDEHIYIDNGLAIQFDNHKNNGKSGLGMLVQFMKYDEK